MAEDVAYSGSKLILPDGRQVPASALSGAIGAASGVSFTQTYATAATTVPAATATAVATDAATDTVPFGYATAAQADAIVTAVNALIADTLALRKTQNAIIDALQAAGIVT